jgi:hypothetical protein
MYRIKGASQSTDSYIELSFREADLWPGDVHGMLTTILLVGDEENGPGIALTSLDPGVESLPGKAHGHASDNFRISLLGSFVMGRERYEPGAFRFQDGWRVYPSDSSSSGADGGWEITMMADRRGTRRRQVQGWVPGSPEAEAEVALQQYFATTFEFDGDLVDSDGSVACGPSALVTTIGPTGNSGKLNGSFADSDMWPAVTSSTRAVVSVMGDRFCGPVVVLAVTAPGETAMPACSFDTEVLRIVVAGSCCIDGRTYGKGDMRMQLPGHRSERVMTGPEGLQEMLVFGDRRYLGVDANCGEEGWPTLLRGITDELLGRLPVPEFADGNLTMSS